MKLYKIQTANSDKIQIKYLTIDEVKFYLIKSDFSSDYLNIHATKSDEINLNI